MQISKESVLLEAMKFGADWYNQMTWNWVYAQMNLRNVETMDTETITLDVNIEKKTRAPPTLPHLALLRFAPPHVARVLPVPPLPSR